MSRDYEIGTSTPADIGGSWSEVIGERELYAAAFCEFGLAEEVIGFLEFEDGTFEVGIGECLRPYQELYNDNNRAKASKAFLEAIVEHSDCVRELAKQDRERRKQDKAIRDFSKKQNIG